MASMAAQRSSAADEPVQPFGFYTLHEVARITRVPISRVRAWRRQGIVRPSLVVTDDEGRAEAGYTFEDAVYLRLLRLLRDEGVPLLPAVRALAHVQRRFGPTGPAWQAARLWVDGRDVFVESDDGWDVTTATRGGQQAERHLLGADFAALRERADALLAPAEHRGTVAIDPAIREGAPVVAGTRIGTAVISALHRRGLSVDAIQRDYYPWLTVEQLQGAIDYEHFLDVAAA